MNSARFEVGRLLRWASLTIIAGGVLGGCASNRAMDNAAQAARSQTETNAMLRRDIEQRDAELASLRQRLSASQKAESELQAAFNRERQRNQELDASYRTLEERFATMPLSPLDPETDRALAALAAQHPGLISYDSQRGMLRFSSDLTFDSGSDAVKESARASLQALSTVLTSSAAGRYEVLIVGHTDSQPISAGTAQRHPTNTHLACHRAISVRNALSSMGVPADRMWAAGWGEHRPIVANNASGGTPANRRVEIYLTRSTAASASSGASTEPAPARKPEQEVFK